MSDRERCSGVAMGTQRRARQHEASNGLRIRTLSIVMSESRTVPSGEVYRQLFEAQAQLSRSLLTGRRDVRTACLSAEDSETHCRPSRRKQQVEDADDVNRLPDAVVNDHPRSDIIDRLTEKKRKKHEEALTQLEAELTHLSQVIEDQVRTLSQDFLSSLQDLDLRLDSLKDRLDQQDHLDHVTVEEVQGLWDQVEQQGDLKKTRILELEHNLRESETQRSVKATEILSKFFLQLENINFLSTPDVCRLIHNQAMMLNQSLLANRRSIARLLLLLREENLQKESLLRLHWEDQLSHWKRSQISKVIDRLRSLCSRDQDQDQDQDQDLKAELAGRREALILQLSSLVPPSMSLVSDWFNQLTAVNQQIDDLHTNFLHQLRLRQERTNRSKLTELQHCQEVLSALQLTDEEVKEVVTSQLLPLIGQSRSQDEHQLAAEQGACLSASRLASRLTRCVFLLLRGAALLWETHSVRLERREEEVQRLRPQQHTSQDALLPGLRQEGSEDALRTALDRHRDQLEAILEELFTYSRSLKDLLHLDHSYTPDPADLQDLQTSIRNPDLVCSGPAHPAHDWLTEAEAALLDLCDISSDVTFTSSRGVAYRGPAFRCPGSVLTDPIPETDLVPETDPVLDLVKFPVELLTHTLSQTRSRVLDHVEQHYHDVLRAAVAMVKDKKEAESQEQEVQLQLDPELIQTQIYQDRLSELSHHRKVLDLHCDDVSETLTSCRLELQDLQTSFRTRIQDFRSRLSTMEDQVLTEDRTPTEDQVLTAGSSRRLEAVSRTLQDYQDQLIQDLQTCQTTSRLKIQVRLEESRTRTAQLLSSLRLFSEGGAFAPHEVQEFQRRLKKASQQLKVMEKSLYKEVHLQESLQQVKEVAAPLEEKLRTVEFIEEVQETMRRTRVQIKAEVYLSNQQQTFISCMLEDLRRMMEDTQVSPDQVCTSLFSVNQELKKRVQYLDFSLVRPGPGPGPGSPEATQQVQSVPGSRQQTTTGVDLLSDPILAVIKTLNRFGISHDPAGPDQQRPTQSSSTQRVPQRPTQTSSTQRVPQRPTQTPSTQRVPQRPTQTPSTQRVPQRPTQTPSTQRVPQRPTQTPSTQRVPQRPTQTPSTQHLTQTERSGCSSIMTKKRFQVFGPEPEQNPQSFSSRLNSVLWRANDVLLLVAKSFYQTQRCSLGRFLLVPDSLDQWTESMQQSLLGYEDETRATLSRSREALGVQLCMLEDLVTSCPEVLIRNHEQQQVAGLLEEVGRVQAALEETLAASEDQRRSSLKGLLLSLGEQELQALICREELRQHQLLEAISCSHLKMQVCVRTRGEEFVTSLAFLTERLLHLMDDLLTPEEKVQQFEDNAVTMETNSTAGPPSNVTMETASITTTRCTLGHLAVIEQRDAAVQRFRLICSSESSRLDKNQRRRMKEAHNWNTHWREQIHTLTHTH